MLQHVCLRSARGARARSLLLLALNAACSIDEPDYIQAPGAGGSDQQMGAGALQGGSAGQEEGAAPEVLPVPAPAGPDPSPAAPSPAAPPPATPAEPPGTPPVVTPQRQGSAATSLLSVSAGQVLEGDTVTFQLVVNDAAGQPLGRGGDVVTFTVSGGDAAGSFGLVQDQGNGTYSAVFTATRAGSALSVGATLDGAAITSAGPSLAVLRYSNRAVSFDGASQFLSLGDLLMVTGSFSLWLNTAATDGYLLSKVVAGESAAGELRLLLEAGRVVFRIESEEIAEARSDVLLNDSRWHHVLVTFNPGLALFVDGQPQGTPNTSNTSGLLVSGATLEIGRNNALGDGLYSGLLDELAFYNRPLTATEALAIYGSGSPGDLLSLSTGGNLLDWWHLGEFDTPPVLLDGVGQRPLTMVDMSASNLVTVDP